MFLFPCVLHTYVPSSSPSVPIWFYLCVVIYRWNKIQYMALFILHDNKSIISKVSWDALLTELPLSTCIKVVITWFLRQNLIIISASTNQMKHLLYLTYYFLPQFSHMHTACHCMETLFPATSYKLYETFYFHTVTPIKYVLLCILLLK